MYDYMIVNTEDGCECRPTRQNEMERDRLTSNIIPVPVMNLVEVKDPVNHHPHTSKNTHPHISKNIQFCAKEYYQNVAFFLQSIIKAALRQ